MKIKSLIHFIFVLFTIFLIPITASSGEWGWAPMISGTTNHLYGVWCCSPTECFAVGASGTILHFNRSSWHSDVSGTPYHLYGVWGSSCSDVFAVGMAGKILHYDGGGWSSMDSGTTNDLWGVWGSAWNNVFAVGTNGTILHYNGSSWHSDESGTASYLYGVWGSSATDVFAVGYSGTILHYNGSSWFPKESGTTNSLCDVWGSSASDVFAVGLSGTIVHYNGSSWHSEKGVPTTNDLLGVWGSSGSDVFAVGTNGTILHYPPGIYSISGTLTGDVKVGLKMTLSGSISANTTTYDASGNYSFTGLNNGTYTVTPSETGYIFTPSKISNITISGQSVSEQNFTAYPAVEGELGWGIMTSGTENDLLGVWGSSPDVFAVGSSGTILNYISPTWSSMDSGTTNILRSVWGSSGSDVFAVGVSGTIRHYNGSSWDISPSGTTTGFQGVWGSSASDVFAVGVSSKGVIFRYNGTSWSEMTSLPIGNMSELWGVWGSSGTNVFAVGYDYDTLKGAILRYSGTWSSMTSGTTNILRSVWGSSGSDVFAVGASGTIVHYNGSTWSPMESGTSSVLYGVWGSSGSDVFAVGASGTILHYNGSTWSPMESGTSSVLKGVWGSSASDVFAVGAAVYPGSGIILHYKYWPFISGTVSGDTKAGVTMSLSGSGLGTETTDASGNYKFTKLSNGTYTVTPSKTKYTFSPSSTQVQISGEWGATEVNFLGSENLSISGTITGEIQADVTMTLSDPVSKETKETTTDGSGIYSFTGVRSGTYTVTPSKDGYYFTPTNIKVTVSGANVTKVDFTSATCHSLSGTVTLSSGSIGSVGGVTIMMVYESVSGDTTTTTTNASGEYSFTTAKNGTYTVTPRKICYSFEPPSRQVTVSGANVTVDNFVATPSDCWSISGTVTGDTQAGVTMTLSGSMSGTTITGTSGNYTFRLLKNGNYTVTPSKDGYYFTPPNKQVTISDADAPGVNFTATATYTISGTVSGDTQADVTMTLSGSGSGITTTNASGNYSFTGLSKGTYTVTPRKTGYTFSPPSTQVTISNANWVVSFIAKIVPTYTISGTVTGDTQTGVTMTLSGSMSGTTITGTSGNYTFRGLINGTYTVTPSKTGYTFTPPSTPVTISNANWMGVNFTAKIVPTYTISGTVSGDTQAGVTMTLSGSKQTNTTTDSSGNYTFSLLSNGTYTVTPSKTNYTFTPPSRTVTISGANVTGVNFTASTTYTISGTVTGDTQAGVTMSLFGSVSANTTTNASGNYTFRGLSNGTYTVTLRKSGYSFEPPYRPVTISGTNVTGVNFTASVASTYTISGTVTGDVLAGVTITILYDSVLGDMTTNTSGNYTFSGVSNGTYTVKPSKANYTFEPASTQVQISGANVTGVNFVAFAVEGCSTWSDVITKYDAYLIGQATWADVIDCYQEYSSTYSISGTVTLSGSGLESVTMTLSGDISAITTTTDSSGNYTFSGLSNGTYTVTPSKTNYTFTPSSTPVIISEADVTGVNFVAFAVGGCSTWADVNAKYEDYVKGEITWAEFFSCYQEYATQ